MKITDIKSYPVWVGHRNQFVLKIETDAGIHGLGEGGLLGRELAVAGAVKHYREWLIGRDPMRIGALWQELYRSQYFEGGRVLMAAQSAIDIALHDIVGKALGVPVYELLGGKHRNHVPCFCSTGIFGQGPAGDEETIERAKALIARGWNALRIGFVRPDPDVCPNSFEPRASIGATATRLIKVREALGPGPVLGIDYHHRLSVAESASFCQRMPSGTLDFIEEPIRDECPEAYEALRKLTDVPFAIGEEISSKWHFMPYIERGLTNYCRVDICNVGGFTEAIKVAGWCEAHYIDLMPHNPLGPICTAAAVHLAAAVPNFSWLEAYAEPQASRELATDLFPVQLLLKGSRYPVPTGPGLGVDLNEALAANQEWAFGRYHPLRRRDGSVTNS